ncbi:MAG TPA: phasin family protein [Chiayiivirga sp.]|nr:phasin family protein [Chiayiivirga sp.]
MAKFKSAKSGTSAPAKRSGARKPAAAEAAPRKEKSTTRAVETDISRGIMDSAQQIWSTGVKALGRAQQESTRLFEALVKEGVNVEKKTRSLTSGKVNAVRDSVENRVEQVKDRAADTWDRLEKVFEERVQRALVRLGVPGREELQALIHRVDQLNSRLRDLATPADAGKNAAPKARPAKPVAKAATKVAKKPAAIPAAVKAPAAKKAAAPRRKAKTETIEAAPAQTPAPAEQD